MQKAWSMRWMLFANALPSAPSQTERVFQAAQALGLPVKLHAEQLSDSGGAQLAARHGALSCDHLEWLSEEGVEGDGQSRQRRGAAARCLLFLARDEVAPG
jgi:hypothetical protein